MSNERFKFDLARDGDKRTPFDPALATVTTTSTMYQLLAIGGVSLSVPTYNGTALTGTPLVMVQACRSCTSMTPGVSSRC